MSVKPPTEEEKFKNPGPYPSDWVWSRRPQQQKEDLSSDRAAQEQQQQQQIGL